MWRIVGHSTRHSGSSGTSCRTICSRSYVSSPWRRLSLPSPTPSPMSVRRCSKRPRRSSRGTWSMANTMAIGENGASQLTPECRPSSPCLSPSTHLGGMECPSICAPARRWPPTRRRLWSFFANPHLFRSPRRPFLPRPTAWCSASGRRTVSISWSRPSSRVRASSSPRPRSRSTTRTSSGGSRLPMSGCCSTPSRATAPSSPARMQSRRPGG